MQTYFRIALVFVFSYLFLLAHVLTQQIADTVDVVATGYGKDVEAAVRNACRAAVEQVVGSMVYAETLVSSGEVVSDKILGFSAGYVESHKQLGEPKVTEDGLVSVRVAAKVQRRKLGEELQKTGINRVMFDGSNFHRKFEMIAENQDAALDLMDQMAKDLYVKAVS